MAPHGNSGHGWVWVYRGTAIYVCLILTLIAVLLAKSLGA